MLVPREEASGPAAGYVDPADDRLVATGVAGELDGAVDQHPPGRREVALVEQLLAGDDRHLVAALQQRPDLRVGQSPEQGEVADVLEPDHVVAR